MNNCGCNQTDSGEMLLVKATPSTASTCEPTSATSSCAKQEPMYDIALSDFLVPSAESSTNMTVCNGAIYAAGMWLEFITPYVKLKISSVNGNIISLINQCDDGEVIPGNPDVGQVIAKNTKFIVSDSAECMTDAEKQTFVEDAISGMYGIPAPLLGTSSSTAIIQPVGLVTSDPADLSAQKLIRRIYGFIFNAGRMFLTQLGSNVTVGDLNYRPLVKHKTNNGVYQRAAYHEYPGLQSDNNYILSVSPTQEHLTPGYVPDMYYKLVDEKGGEDPLTWPAFTNYVDEDYDLSSYSIIDEILTTRSHYYVMARVEIAVRKAGSDVEPTEVRLNDRIVGRVMAATSADYLVQYNSISVPIKVFKNNHQLTLALKTTGSVWYSYRLHIDGIYK